MFGPSLSTTHMANARHAERLDHAARIHQVQDERRHGESPISAATYRLMTVRRLAAAKVAAIFGSTHAHGGAATHR